MAHTQATPLSIHKFYQIVQNKGYHVVRDYCIGEQVKFLELMSPKAFEPFIIYVRSKYIIRRDPNSPASIWVKPYDPDSEPDPSSEEPQQNHTSTAEEEGGAKDTFEPVSTRYIERFKEYTDAYQADLVVLANDQLCVIDDPPIFYRFEGVIAGEDTASKRALVMVDIETFYEKIDTLENDLLKIIGEIRTRGNQFNQASCEKNAKKLKDYASRFYSSGEKISGQIAFMQNEIQRMNMLHQQILETKGTLYEKLKSLSASNIGAIASMYSDINNSTERKTIQQNIGRAEQLQLDVEMKIYRIQNELNNLYLAVDRVSRDIDQVVDDLDYTFDKIRTAFKLAKNLKTENNKTDVNSSSS